MTTVTEVAELFETVLRLWVDRRVDGFGVDVAHGLVDDRRFPSFPGSPLSVQAKMAAPSGIRTACTRSIAPGR